jgi:predicted RNase H-like nuclease (RuvC/YqgF family)
MIGPMPTTAGEQEDPLTAAYEQRTTQLHEARGALAEAVSVLKVELDQRREESKGLREHADNLAAEADKQRHYAESFTAEIQQLRKDVARLEAELQATRELLASVRNMRVVRWTVWPRRIVYRLRARG